MKKLFFLTLALLLAALPASAQRMTDKLDRGLVAVPAQSGSGYFISWRMFGEEYYGYTYNIYRGTTKLNRDPLQVSNYTDVGGTAASTYQVEVLYRGQSVGRSATVKPWTRQYKEFAVANVVNRLGVDVTTQYNINDIALADLTGDGVAEFIVKRNFGGDYNESEGNYPVSNTTTFNHIEVYNISGQRLWWIDLGPNMVSGPDEQYDAVGFDWDQDGKAEVLMRGADNMIIHCSDGTTVNIGNMNVNTRGSVYHADANMSYTNTGNEYLLYLEGATGKPYSIGSGSTPLWMTYPLPRGNANDWGDGYGHRSTKHYFGAPYLDGKHASIFLGRGCYTKHHMKAFDVDPLTHKLTMRWEFSGTSWPWSGQGYHNFGIADVDWDGRDEIVFGSMVVDDNGKGLHTTGLGHGDAQHCGDFDPYRHGQEIFACNEDAPAMNYRNAVTGKIYYRLQSTADDGRALCGNFSNEYPGAMGHSSQSATISCVVDKPIQNGPGGFTNNFRIYWDSDLLEEGLDGASSREGASRIFKADGSPIFTADGTANCNWTKNTPSATGDILGDWREEIVARTSDNKYIRIYTTNYPMAYRNYTLWHDHQYRQGMVWESVGYNQPPHASYFIGELEGITVTPPPYTNTGRTLIGDGDIIMGDYNDQQILISDTKDISVTVNDGASPYVAIFNAPSWVQGTGSTKTDGTATINRTYYTCTVSGGAFSGNTRLVKQGDGILNLPNVEQQYTGPTDVWAGTVNFDGKLEHSSLWLNRFTEFNSDGGTFRSIKMEYDAKLCPGRDGKISTITTDSLLLGIGARVVFDLISPDAQNPCDVLYVNFINIDTKNWEYGPKYQSPVFEFVPQTPSVDELVGEFKIARVGTIQGTLGDIRIEGLGTSKKSSLVYEDGYIKLIISDVRLAGSIIWNGSVSNVWDFAESQNFTLASNPDVTDETFVTGDKVLFTAGVSQYNVQLKGNLEADSVIVDGNRSYSFGGTGAIVGNSKLVKRGTSTLTITNDNTYTGGTLISGGTVSVTTLSNSTVAAGNLGGVTAQASRFIIENGATLRSTAAVTQGSPMQMRTEEGGVVNNMNDFIIASPVMGTKLTKKGNGWMKLNVNSPSLQRLVIAAGTVQCVSCNTPAQTVEFQGTSTLKENTGSSYAIYVDANAKARWEMVTDQTYRNSLSGKGTITVYCPSRGGGSAGNYWLAPRTPIAGNWSEFEGTVVPEVNTYQGLVASWTLSSSYGMPKGTLNIPSNVTVTNDGKTYRIGKVTGTGKLGGYETFSNSGSGTNTWELGYDKNYDMEAVVVNGWRGDATRVTKVGTGRISVKSKWTNSGTVAVNEGELRLTTTACLGTGQLTVGKEGLLGGVTGSTALTNSSVRVDGTLRVGTTQTTSTGTINFGGKNVTFARGSVLQLCVRRCADDQTENTGGTNLSNVGILSMNGTIDITVPDNHILAEGDSVILWTATRLSGTPTLASYIVDEAKGLVWDDSDLAQGILRVKYDPATAVRSIEPEVADDNAPIYSIDGRRMPTLSREALRPGIYIQRGRKFIVK